MASGEQWPKRPFAHVSTEEVLPENVVRTSSSMKLATSAHSHLSTRDFFLRFYLSERARAGWGGEGWRQRDKQTPDLEEEGP